MRSLIIILSIGLFTCRAPVVFQEIQPAGVPNASQFPAGLIGTYYSVSRDSAMTDSAFVRIDKKQIILSNVFTGVIYARDTASMRDMLFRRDSVYLSFGDLTLPSMCRFDHDSASIRFQWERPLFSYTDTSYLRIYDARCFLNYKTNSGYYTDVMWLNRDTLIHGSIADKKEISLMEVAVPDGQDPVILRPSKEQLIRFIQKGGFSARDKFKRL